MSEKKRFLSKHHEDGKSSGFSTGGHNKKCKTDNNRDFFDSLAIMRKMAVILATTSTCADG
jgi:hypothetical protein